jgi:predicted secreted protein
MKKITIILTAAIMLFTTSAFAMEGDVATVKVKAGFSKDFATATQVKWEKTGDFYFADFLFEGKSFTAAYNEEGVLVGTSRSFDPSQLPLNISESVMQQYKGYKLGPVATELKYDGQTSYIVTVEKDNEVLKLKSDINGDITELSKK